MRQPLDRRNTTALGRWWWTIDRTTLFCVMALICIGLFLVMAGSPPVARRIGLTDFYFVSRHQMFLAVSTVVMMGVSILDDARIKKIALLGFIASVVLLMLLPVIGYENKGSVRWLRVGGMSIQPSEFMKPCFAVILGWIFSRRLQHPEFPAYRIAICTYVLVAFLLLIQTDLGMTVTITGMFGIQFFLAGMPFLWVFGMIVLGMGGLYTAYSTVPYIASRFDRFLNPSAGDNYQVQKSLEAFKGGGWFGRGPGEGLVKQHIPDSHTDFIFSVAGEEFGVVFCLLIMLLFATIVVRGYLHMAKEEDSFRMIAVGGLLAEFGIQAIVNMGVAVNLLPAKGMTLPFLSYGGSSLIAMAGGMGMMLALTRKRYGKAQQRGRMSRARAGRA